MNLIYYFELLAPVNNNQPFPIYTNFWFIREMPALNAGEAKR